MKKLLFVLLVPVLVLGLMSCSAEENLSVFNPDRAVPAELQGMYTSTTATGLQTLITASQMTVRDMDLGGNVTLGVEADIYIGKYFPGTLASTGIIMGYEADGTSAIEWIWTDDDDTNRAKFDTIVNYIDSHGYLKLFRLDDWKPVGTLTLDLANMNLQSSGSDFVLMSDMNQGYLLNQTNLVFYQKDIVMDYFNHMIPIAGMNGETYEKQ